LEGAQDFVAALRAKVQLIILSDTFEEFAKPLMEKLGNPTPFCNTLVTAPDGRITDYKVRQRDGKKQAVIAFQSMNMRVFAAGDSYNDLAMIERADSGALFRAPPAISAAYPLLPHTETYEELMVLIDAFLAG
jgi:phosphoserine/homoserine phosphotransferase